MPMYYPDLKSIQNLATIMRKNAKGKEYHGIIPKNEKELPVARKELGRYFREVWGDEIQAIEVEQAATKENYHEAISKGLGF